MLVIGDEEARDNELRRIWALATSTWQAGTRLRLSTTPGRIAYYLNKRGVPSERTCSGFKADETNTI